MSVSELQSNTATRLLLLIDFHGVDSTNRLPATDRTTQQLTSPQYQRWNFQQLRW